MMKRLVLLVFVFICGLRELSSQGLRQNPQTPYCAPEVAPDRCWQWLMTGGLFTVEHSSSDNTVITKEPNNSKDNAIRWAYTFDGDDLGAKINAAIDDLAFGPGEIWIDQRAGTSISTPVIATHPGQIIRFVQGGVYGVSATLSVAQIIGSGFGGAHIVGTAPTALVQVDGANLPYVINVIFDSGSIQELEIVANRDGNPAGLDGIYTEKREVLIRDVKVTSATRHNIYVKSTTTTSNSGALPRLFTVLSYQAGEAGLRVEDATDLWVSDSCEFEDNGTYGIHLHNSAGSRILNSDLAQNRDHALFVEGVTGGIGSHQILVVGNQFGQNYKEDIFIAGHDDAGYTSIANVISGNQFWGGKNRADNDTAAIILQDTLSNVVSGNVFQSIPGASYRYGIAAINSGFSNVDYWGPNAYLGPFGGGGVTSPVAGITHQIDGSQ
jgi:hypothetical protein